MTASMIDGIDVRPAKTTRSLMLEGSTQLTSVEMLGAGPDAQGLSEHLVARPGHLVRS